MTTPFKKITYKKYVELLKSSNFIVNYGYLRPTNDLTAPASNITPNPREELEDRIMNAIPAINLSVPHIHQFKTAYTSPEGIGVIEYTDGFKTLGGHRNNEYHYDGDDTIIVTTRDYDHINGIKTQAIVQIDLGDENKGISLTEAQSKMADRYFDLYHWTQMNLFDLDKEREDYKAELKSIREKINKTSLEHNSTSDLKSSAVHHEMKITELSRKINKSKTTLIGIREILESWNPAKLAIIEYSKSKFAKSELIPALETLDAGDLRLVLKIMGTIDDFEEKVLPEDYKKHKFERSGINNLYKRLIKLIRKLSFDSKIDDEFLKVLGFYSHPLTVSESDSQVYILQMIGGKIDIKIK